MNEIAGLREAFKQSRIVFLTTFSDGGENSRQMTNLNENPYQTMWFPTYRNTQKIRDIEENPKVLITFPSSRDGEYYEIEGRAEFEDGAEVEVVVPILAPPPEDEVLLQVHGPHAR